MFPVASFVHPKTSLKSVDCVARLRAGGFAVHLCRPYDAWFQDAIVPFEDKKLEQHLRERAKRLKAAGKPARAEPPPRLVAATLSLDNLHAALAVTVAAGASPPLLRGLCGAP